MLEQPPDLLMLDLIMPVLDGFELLARKEATPQLADIPVIVLSVTSAAEDALARQGSQFSIHRPGGLRLVEVLRCLRAVSEALNPHNGSTSVPEALETSVSDKLQCV
jgi:CheY-like chemotaxis protein